MYVYIYIYMYTINIDTDVGSLQTMPIPSICLHLPSNHHNARPHLPSCRLAAQPRH